MSVRTAEHGHTIHWVRVMRHGREFIGIELWHVRSLRLTFVTRQGGLGLYRAALAGWLAFRRTSRESSPDSCLIRSGVSTNLWWLRLSLEARGHLISG